MISHQVSTTLVSMNDLEIMDRILMAALNPLTEKEARVRSEIMHKYFNPLPFKHWEGVELAKYKEAMEQLKVI